MIDPGATMRSFFLTLLATALVAQVPLEKRFQEDLAFLAGPALQGRGNGYPGLDQAAGFLVKGYEGLGLHPTLQRYSFVDRIARKQAQATLGDGTVLSWGKDIEAIGFSADGKFSGKPLIFAGYGMKSGGYDDLEGLDPKGKVVLIARRVPDLMVFAPAARASN